MRFAKFLVSLVVYGGLATYFYTGYTYGGPYAGAHFIACVLFVFLGIWNSIIVDQND